MRRPLTLATSLTLAATLALTGCGSDDGTATPDDPTTAASTETEVAAEPEAPALEVAASFYPLQWVTERVGGDRVEVTSLTPPGAEPHDLELSPTDVATVARADLVVFLSGFQPAVDEAITQAEGATLDAADHAEVTLTATVDDGHDHGGDDHSHEGEEHAEEKAEGKAEGAATDPHFWLDPLRLADVGDALADQLVTLDAANAEDYRANAAALRHDLEQLDADYTEGLASCASKELVTSHAAFGYLADRYGFTQLGISGLSPEDEPSPADLAEATEFVQEHDVATIYFETLVSPTIAETVAAETGAETAVLDPIEGLTEDSAGEDYLEVMRSNLATLRSGQSCT